MNFELILENALEIGKLLLENGAETQRIEDTVTRICCAGGAADVQVFAITSAIYATLTAPDGTHYTQLKRADISATDLYMIEQSNSLSRRICSGTLPIHDVRHEIDSICKIRPYHVFFRYLGACIATFSLCLLSAGSLRDAVCCALSAIAVTAADMYKPPHLNRIALTIFLSLTGGILAMLFTQLGLGDNYGKIMTGTVMILIPGAAIGVSLRDVLLGDMISGILRFFHSLLTAAAIAVGFACAIVLFGGGV